VTGAVLKTARRSCLSLVIAFLLGGALIASLQHDIKAPFAAYNALFTGAFGSSSSWANTLRQTMPLLLTGMAVAVALSAGLFNIGAEGQMAVGGLAAAVAGYGLKDVLPGYCLLPFSCMVGALAGAVWATPPVLLRVTRGVHEVITAILFNYIAQNLTRYLAAYPLKDPAGQAPQTPEVGATLPRLWAAYDVHAGLPLALILVCLFAWALRYTVWGYETRAVGQGKGAAEAAGIAVRRVQVTAMLLSGAIAGLAGAVLILGEVPFRRFPADFYGVGYGFDGLAVALLASGSAWGVIPAALLFGGMNAGAEAMAFSVGTPKQIVQVIQGILIVAISATAGLTPIRRNFRSDSVDADGRENHKADVRID